MDEQQKIKLISLMYNVRFEREASECLEPACRHGQCICLDREQAGLLLGALSGKDTFRMEAQSGRVSYLNTQMLSETEKYNECKITKGFYPCVFIDADREKINGMIGEAVAEGETRFTEMLGSIPVIYLTNSINEISERDSLNYLCVYAPCVQWYMDRLLRTAICGAIECCLSTPKDQWLDYTKTMAEIFRKFNDIWKSYGKIREEIVKVMKDYSDNLLHISRWCAQKRTESAMIRNARNAMDVYRSKVNNSSADLAFEAEKCIQWYRILKKIFEVMGIDTNIFPGLPFDTSQKQKSDYDAVVQLIGELKGNEERRRKVFEKIKNVLMAGEDITDKAQLRELWYMAGYPDD